MTPFRAQRIWERNYLVYRRVWKVVITGFFEPVFYLFSIGIGIGSLVGEVTMPGGVTVDYTAFVAPALMAASAMNGTVLETTFNIFFRLKFDRVYDGILTTPLGPRDIAIGEIGWALLRGALYAVAFLIVMVIMGLTTNWWAILTIPALSSSDSPSDRSVSPPPLICAHGRTSTWCPWSRCRCSCSPRPSIHSIPIPRPCNSWSGFHRFIKGTSCSVLSRWASWTGRGRPHRISVGDGPRRRSRRLSPSRRVVAQIAAN